MADLSDVIQKLQRLPVAIADSLEREVWDVLYVCIEDSAQKKVYSYNPNEYFRSKRREFDGGLIDPDNYSRTVDTNGDESILTVQNVTPLQNLWSDTHTEPLTPVVESGDSRYYQPYPRPFMDAARDRVMGGLAQQALERGLVRQGYDVV